MAFDLINLGGVANDGTGDDARTAGGKINVVIQAMNDAGAFNGSPIKPVVKYATAAALATNTYTSGVLTASANGALSVDGASPAAADRILVKDESSGLKNGVYVVTQVGDGSHPFILTRAEDMNAWAEVVGAIVVVEQGSANADTGWECTSNSGGTLGTTAIAFVEFSSGAINSTRWGFLAALTSFVGGLFSASNLAGFVTALGGASTVLASLSGAPLASPALTGAPTAPTASGGTNTTQIATTAFVKAAIDVVLGGVSSAFDTLSEIATDLATRALKTTTVSAAGLATGGGDLSANRTITVPAASDAEARAQASSSKSLTPSNLSARTRARMSLSASQAGIASATNTKILLNTADLDNDSIIDTTNNRVVPKAGKPVRISWAGLMTGATPGDIARLDLYKNGTIVRNGIGGCATITSGSAQSGGEIFVDNPNGTDYYEVYGRGISTGTLTVSGGSAVNDAHILVEAM